jgi:hypothetical protein
LTISYWCVTQARQGWTSILRSTLKMDEHLLEKRVQALSLSWGKDKRAPCARRRR